jgi:predicted enzyme related to lactoylglutathione lyase
MSPPNPSRVVHLELHTGDRLAASEFYEAVCGWRRETVHTAAGAYHCLALGGEVGGGVVEGPTPRSLWLPYVEVEQVGEITERARAHGARVLVEPREGPAGWRSVVATEAAGEIAFWHRKR